MWNQGLSKDRLNPEWSLGVEVVAKGMAPHAGPEADRFLAAAGVVVQKNFSIAGGAIDLSASVVGHAGVIGGPTGHRPYADATLSVGGSFDLTPGPKHEPPKPEAPKDVTAYKGIVAEVDPGKDRLVMYLGDDPTGHPAYKEFKLSAMRSHDPAHFADDAKAFDHATRRGERIDITDTGGALKITNDLGPQNAWLKEDLLKRAQSLPNGDLKIDNLTIHNDEAGFYKAWLARPAGPNDGDLIDNLQKAADVRSDARTEWPAIAKKAAELGITDVYSWPANADGRRELGNVADGTPDFSRGSGDLPSPKVHMAADGKGGERGLGLFMKGCTLVDKVDKDGVTTYHYKHAGRDGAISVPDTVGGFATSPSNPYNNAAIDAGMQPPYPATAGREAAQLGAKDLLRSLDSARGPVSLAPAGDPSAFNKLLGQMRYDPNTKDVQIGGLTIKGDAAGFYLKVIQEEGPRDPELVARLQRFADSKQPVVIDLAKTREMAFKERDQLGFGEPPNPVKVGMDRVQAGSTFDLTVAADKADPKNRSKDTATLVDYGPKDQPREVPLQTQIHSYGAAEPQAQPQRHQPGREAVHR
jgi:hypothetical protein